MWGKRSKGKYRGQESKDRSNSSSPWKITFYGGQCRHRVCWCDPPPFKRRLNISHRSICGHLALQDLGLLCHKLDYKFMCKQRTPKCLRNPSHMPNASVPITPLPPHSESWVPCHSQSILISGFRAISHLPGSVTEAKESGSIILLSPWGGEICRLSPLLLQGAPELCVSDATALFLDGITLFYGPRLSNFIRLLACFLSGCLTKREGLALSVFSPNGL
jgi:hypothetical protein